MSKYAFSQRSKMTLKAFVTVLLAGTAAGCSSDLSRFSYHQAVNGDQLTTASVQQPYANSLAPVGVGTQSYPGSYRAPSTPATGQPIYQPTYQPNYQAASVPAVSGQSYPGDYRSPTPLYTASVPTSAPVVASPVVTGAVVSQPILATPPVSAPVLQPATTVSAPIITPATAPAVSNLAVQKKLSLTERIRNALNRTPKKVVNPPLPVARATPIIRPLNPVVAPVATPVVAQAYPQAYPQAQDPITTSSVRAPTVATSAPTIVPMAPDPIVTGSIPPVGKTPKGGWTTIGATRVNLAEGETVYNLSRRYGVPAAEILKANNIADSRTIKAGQPLTIPVYVYSSAAPVSAPDNDILTQSASSYRGSKTLFPRGSNTPVPSPRNGQIVSVSATPQVQQPVKVPVTGPVTGQVASQSGTHTVVSGDTLNRIAYKHKVKVADLKSANGLSGSSIRIGQKLKIPGASYTPMTPDRSVTTATVTQPTTPIPNPASQQTVTETAMLDNNVAAPENTGIGKLRWPAKGQIVTSFGGRTDEGKRNDGIDILLPEGTEIKAAENGVVIYADSGLKGYGNTVLIRHKNEIVTVYAHAKQLKVKRGDNVQRGQVVALSGMSGTAKHPKLHFEVRQKATPQNPISFLD